MQAARAGLGVDTAEDGGETITTAPTRSARNARSTTAANVSGTDVSTDGLQAAGGEPQSQPSVLNQWVSELAGTPAGMRVPTREEIAHLTTMFPDAPRERIVSVLQRRYVSILTSSYHAVLF